MNDAREPIFGDEGPRRERTQKHWTPEELDKVLNLWFSGVSMNGVACALDRPKYGIQVLPWKLATKYIPYTPTPGARTNRTGRHWGGRDVAMLEYAQGAEAARRGVDVAYLAGVLGRSVEEVAYRWEKTQSTATPPAGEGFGL